jgi:hypothetical protein
MAYVTCYSYHDVSGKRLAEYLQIKHLINKTLISHQSRTFHSLLRSKSTHPSEEIETVPRESQENGNPPRERDHRELSPPPPHTVHKISFNDKYLGYSLAGLFSGLFLKHLGHNVRIFERSPSASLQSQGQPPLQNPKPPPFSTYEC